MRKIITCAAVLVCFACKKVPKPAELERHLKKAMLISLYEAVNNDSSKVKYDIQQVFYYEEKNAYDCEFKVRMLHAKQDTTGIMQATISKDFSKVTRKS